MKPSLASQVVYSYKDVPTLLKFSKDNSRIRGVIGPFGSGKSSAMVIEILSRAQQQVPNSQGIRNTRWMVVRNTFPQLRDSTIKTFLDWVPPKYFGKFHDTYHEYRIDKIFLPDGTQVVCEVLFRALDRPDHVRNLLSLELTGAWLNEAREIPKAILDGLDGRIDRWPSKRQGGATWAGIFLDTNPPDVDHWWFKLFETKKPEGYVIFKQPSGRGPEAENLSNLAPKYYENLAIGKDPEFIKVYVDGQYGFVMDGQVVFPNWNDTLHVAPEKLSPTVGLPVIVGFDFGVRNPAAVFGQYHPRGKMLVLDEIIAESMGIRQFYMNLVKPLLLTKYRGYEIIATGDPSGAKRSDNDERSCFLELKDMGLPTVPAWSQSIEARINAVDSFLTKLFEGQSAFQLSPSCNTIRKGFNGGYHYRRVQASGDERFYNIPEKNKYCVDLKTEILTVKGWQQVNELKKNDAVISYDLNKKSLVMDHLTDVHYFTGKTKINHFYNQQFSMMLTDQHRCLVEHRNTRQNIWSAGFFIAADQLNGAHRILSVARIDEKLGRPALNYSDDFVRLTAWIATEGSYRRKDNTIMLSQSIAHNPKYVQFIDKLLQHSPCLVSRHQFAGNPNMITWKIGYELAESIKRVMPNKYPSAEYILFMTNAQRRSFIYESIRGDGTMGVGQFGPLPDMDAIVRNRDLFCNRSFTPRIFQKDKGLIDALQMMASLIGLRTIVHPRANGNVISFNQKQYNHVSVMDKEIGETEDVWCPQTHHGTWLARRDGTVFITGNSHPLDALQYLCMYVDHSIQVTKNRTLHLGAHTQQPTVPSAAWT